MEAVASDDVVVDVGAGVALATMSTETSSEHGPWKLGGGPAARAAVQTRVGGATYLGLSAQYRLMFYVGPTRSGHGLSGSGTPVTHELDVLPELEFGFGGRVATGPTWSWFTNPRSVYMYPDLQGETVSHGWAFDLGFNLSRRPIVTVGLSMMYSFTWQTLHWHPSLLIRTGNLL